MASAQAISRRTVVAGVVIGIHVVFLIGLVAGTAIRAVPQIRDILDTRLIQPEDEAPPKEPPPPPPDFKPPPVQPPPMLDIPMVMGPPSETAIVVQKPIEQPRPAEPPRPQPPPVTQARIARGVDLAALCPYPSASRRLGEAGSVVVLFYVTSNGRATEAKIETSSGFPRLDEAAVNCLRRGRYEPSRVGNEAVDSWQRIKWTWRLEG